MITIELEASDLENIRFAFSPLVELSTSYRVLNTPARHGLYVDWIEEAQRALYGLELPYMDAVILPKHYVADFVTPTPLTTRQSIEDELATLQATPDEIIRKNVRMVIGHSEESEIRQHFLVRPREALDCLTEELRLYWQRTLSHHWPSIHSILEGDILYQARQLALYGVDSMFASLSPKLSYQNAVIRIDKDHDLGNVRLNGTGIQLVPAVFGGQHVSWQVVPEWHPMVIYGARGAGLWQYETLPEPEQALLLALGAGRAKVLLALKTPAHTGELARKLNVTSGAISQQLNRLHQAGLVVSQRSSNRVYYRLTERGEKLLTLFSN